MRAQTVVVRLLSFSVLCFCSLHFSQENLKILPVLSLFGNCLLSPQNHAAPPPKRIWPSLCYFCCKFLQTCCIVLCISSFSKMKIHDKINSDHCLPDFSLKICSKEEFLTPPHPRVKKKKTKRSRKLLQKINFFWSLFLRRGWRKERKKKKLGRKKRTNYGRSLVKIWWVQFLLPSHRGW